MDKGVVDTFIRTFERIAEVNGWPEDKYVAIMYQHFSKKARKVFLGFPIGTVYDVLKERLLLAYDIVPEWHRQFFRSQQKMIKKLSVITLTTLPRFLSDGSKVMINELYK